MEDKLNINKDLKDNSYINSYITNPVDNVNHILNIYRELYRWTGEELFLKGLKHFNSVKKELLDRHYGIPFKVMNKLGYSQYDIDKQWLSESDGVSKMNMKMKDGKIFELIGIIKQR